MFHCILIIGVSDQLCLGGGRLRSFPRIFSQVWKTRKTCWGGGWGGICAPISYCFLCNHIPTAEDYIRVLHIASIWKATPPPPPPKKKKKKKKKLARKPSGFAQILLDFCPNNASWKIIGGLQPPPPHPQPPYHICLGFSVWILNEFWISHTWIIEYK